MTPEHFDTQMARLNVLSGLLDDITEYFAALQDIPDARFTVAVSHALKTRVWFPKPAELRADCDAVAPSVIPEREVSQLEPLPGGPRDLVVSNPFSGKELRIKVTRVWKFDCDECSDTGWRSRQCGAQPGSSTLETLRKTARAYENIDVSASAHCGRRQDHAPHEWVDRCMCLDWNPTIKRRKEAGAKYSQSPEKVGA